jgi:multiple sugar transport system substrate-binding protein
LKKGLLGFITAACVMISGCGSEGSHSVLPSSSPVEERQKLTILHINAEKKGFQEFIRQAEEKLNMEITVEKCPDNADNRQAKISTILASGDKTVDLISVNDEMISEFKHKGYLVPLEEDVMTEETRKGFPQKYLESICEADGHIYSVPFLMDVMMFWVNQEFLNQAGLDEIKDMDDIYTLQKSITDPDEFAYGDAWENTYIYNSIGEFVNFWGGDYMDWMNPRTQEAVRSMKKMLEDGITSPVQLVDQYEQMEEKFIRGKYGCIFMYTGALSTFRDANVYGKNKIHMAYLPQFREKATNIATWQYVLNNASEHKEAAVKFLQYAASYEGCADYAKLVKSYPARLDVIEKEDINLEEIDMVREYLQEYTLNARPLCENSIEAISNIGTLFQEYVLGQCEEESFFEQAQKCIETYYK